jgi:hypothetical protein
VVERLRKRLPGWLSQIASSHFETCGSGLSERMGNASILRPIRLFGTPTIFARVKAYIMPQQAPSTKYKLEVTVTGDNHMVGK